MEPKKSFTDQDLQKILVILGIAFTLVVYSFGFLGFGPLFNLVQRGVTQGMTNTTGLEKYKEMSSSMSPTISEGDTIMANTKWYEIEPLRRGDVVLMSLPDYPQVSTFRRLIGLEGDTVFITGGGVYVNGQPLREPYVMGDNRAMPHSLEYGPFKVPQGEVFVLGDNRDVAKDSRYWVHVSRRHIQGKAISVFSSGSGQPKLREIK